MKKVTKIIVKNIAILIPLTFESHYPLRREFWNSETHDFTLNDRIAAFVKATESTELHRVLITPGLLDKIWRFSAPIPFLPTNDNKSLEQFMLHSNWSVEERAKYAGIYKIEKPEYINVETKQIIPKNLNPQEESQLN